MDAFILLTVKLLGTFLLFLVLLGAISLVSWWLCYQWLGWKRLCDALRFYRDHGPGQPAPPPDVAPATPPPPDAGEPPLQTTRKGYG